MRYIRKDLMLIIKLYNLLAKHGQPSAARFPSTIGSKIRLVPSQSHRPDAQLVKDMKLSAEESDKVFWKNAARLLKLPIAEHALAA